MKQTKVKRTLFHLKNNLPLYLSEIPFLLVCMAPFCFGLFYEAPCAITAVLLSLWLIKRWKEKGHLDIYINMTSVGIIVICLGYIVSIAWAVDKGIAVWGIVKYLPVLFFMISVMQMSGAVTDNFLNSIPILGCIMTICSGILALTPWKQFVLVDGRLAGSFQYPNTYAVYLLTGLIVLMFPDTQVTEKCERSSDREMNLKYNIRIVFLASVLMSGIFLSGSRTVFVLLVFTIGIASCLDRRIKVKLLIIGIFIVMVSAVVLYVFICDKQSGMSRFLLISWKSSSFLGRILYMKDALCEIIKKPLGLGYLGYFFSQPSFQTGVYSVRFVHNDILQIFLDTGWVPGIMFVCMILFNVISKKVSLRCRIIMIMLALHGMLDFDLQYIAIFFVWIICMKLHEGKCRSFKYPPSIPLFVMVNAVFCIYLGAATCNLVTGLPDTALMVYPWNTFARIEELKKEENPKKAEEMAVQILRQNPYVSIAWSARARAAYTNGDFEKVIKYKKKAIAYNRYDIAEYADYFEMLKVGIRLYGQNGDMESATVCLKEIQNIQVLINEVKAQTSKLAWKIEDKPELKMPAEYYQYLE